MLPTAKFSMRENGIIAGSFSMRMMTVTDGKGWNFMNLETYGK
jgi:hypothetical protein